MAGHADSLVLSSDRLASLSDTMFGVAMTLVVASLLPTIQTLKGSVLDAPPGLTGELVTVVLSFTISARYWIAQQLRLAATPRVSGRQTWLHLLFLFLIVLVPLTSSLPGLTGRGAVRVSVLIYGAHLASLAVVNLLLWLDVHRSTAVHVQLVRSGLSLTLFAVGLAVGAVRPELAMFSWFAVLPAQRLVHPLTRLLFAA